MPDNIRKLLGELKKELVRMYGERLKGVYLYGSYARGEDQPGSNADVMIMLASNLRRIRRKNEQC